MKAFFEKELISLFLIVIFFSLICFITWISNGEKVQMLVLGSTFTLLGSLLTMFHTNKKDEEQKKFEEKENLKNRLNDIKKIELQNTHKNQIIREERLFNKKYDVYNKMLTSSLIAFSNITKVIERKKGSIPGIDWDKYNDLLNPIRLLCEDDLYIKIEEYAQEVNLVKINYQNLHLTDPDYWRGLTRIQELNKEFHPEIISLMKKELYIADQ